MENKTGYDQISHTLPDGQIIKVNSQQIRVPEALFDPSLIGFDEKGIHQMVTGDIKLYAIFVPPTRNVLRFI